MSKEDKIWQIEDITFGPLNIREVTNEIQAEVPIMDIADSLLQLFHKSNKDIEIKISFEAITADTGEFVAYGKPVWMKIPKE